MKTIDTLILGRKTSQAGLRLGTRFDLKQRAIVFSRQPRPADAPRGVEFVSDAIGLFVRQLRSEAAKDVWLMGGGELIADFLDADAIDEFVVSVVRVFVGDDITLIGRRYRQTPLVLESAKPFEDGLGQRHYQVQATT